MKSSLKIVPALTFLFICGTLWSQDYFLGPYGPFDSEIPTPAAFLGYDIGTHHTRHDRIVSYFETLAELSGKASFSVYGETYEHRPLIMLTVSSEEHISNLDEIQDRHLQVVDPGEDVTDFSTLPVFVNLGYNVHGNEPSSSEAAMLAAYILIASQSDMVRQYLEEGVFFIDPVINPDGRDRHTQWANMYKGTPPVSDPEDEEHNEAWPRGRTNHYWFDLNRDWWLAVHPESRSKLQWYHQWYPNVVTDFHEMGTNSTYFFEPMKTNGSLDPVMPRENYTTLSDTFARYYSDALDEIGSLYFTKEVFDGTYPGYGSSYPDLQGGLGLLFEQASSRGHVQDRPMGELTFAFTIRNQLTSTMASVKASVEQKEMMYQYQKDFFRTAIKRAEDTSIHAYVFGDPVDQNRNKAFVEKLLAHKVKVHSLAEDLTVDGQEYGAGKAFVVPTAQPQYRIIQNAFETYSEYADSVFYDASAWSLVNFYNLPYHAVNAVSVGDEIVVVDDLIRVIPVSETRYAYLIPGTDYYVPSYMYYLKKGGVRFLSAFKKFTAEIEGQPMEFGYGSLVIPVGRQEITSDSLHRLINGISDKLQVQAYAVHTGYSLAGVDLGSRYLEPVSMPKAVMLVGGSVSSYEAGEVWHLLDTRVGMPITKIREERFSPNDLSDYTTLVMVSGAYRTLDSTDLAAIKSWISKGNTLIASRQAVSWCLRNKLVSEKLVKSEKDTTERSLYVDAREELGREAVGGAIFQVELDITHPVAFGYTRKKLPVYRNSTVWLQPSESPYGTVAQYSENPHLDGFITEENLEDHLKGSASVVVSEISSGRAILFVDNPNFRGSWYGTNRMFLNALFLGEHIRVPSSD